MLGFRLPRMYSIIRYCHDWNPDELPKVSRNRVYSAGVIVRSTSQAVFNCSKIRDTRASILNMAVTLPAFNASRAAVSSWIANFIHSSLV